VDVIDGERFHREGRPFYQAPPGDAVPGWANVKRAGGMARVAYEPNHPNPAESGSRAGRGRTVSTWLACERAGDGEGLLTAPLRLLVDVALDPGASIGLHVHDATEEVWYVLDGTLTITLAAPGGAETTAELRRGDLCATRLGQAHTGVAGAAGARVLVIDVAA
jgi:hypothetical protein